MYLTTFSWLSLESNFTSLMSFLVIALFLASRVMRLMA